MTQKVFTKEHWAELKIVSEPTRTRAMIKADTSGTHWLWLSSGKRVTAKALPFTGSFKIREKYGSRVVESKHFARLAA